MNYKNIRLDIADQIATITLSVPEKLNACSLDMADEINDALDRIDAARVLIICGEGKGFCSGADLSGDQDNSITGGRGSYRALTRHYNPMLLKLHRLPIPTISAVNGVAAGVGCSLSLTTDFVIASSTAYFLQAFVNIGLVPDGGASWILTRLIGKARTTELMMLGEKLSAQKAMEWGAIHKVVEPENLQEETLILAKRLATSPTVALGIMRNNLAAAMECDYSTTLLTEAEGQRIASDSNDAREGALAFMEKRKAKFEGN